MGSGLTLFLAPLLLERGWGEALTVCYKIRESPLKSYHVMPVSISGQQDTSFLPFRAPRKGYEIAVNPEKSIPKHG